MPVLLAFFLLFIPSSVSAASDIVVNRVQTGGENASDEFVELANLSAQDISLSGFSLRKLKGSAADCASSALVSAAKFSGSIAAGGRFLIRHPEYAIPADLAYSSASYSISDNTGIVLLDGTGKQLDAVAWGDGCGGEGAPTDNPDDGETLARRTENGTPVDTDDNKNDFAIVSAPAPAPGTETVRISEVFPDPDAPEDAGEFIELHNYGDEAVELGGWTLRDGSKTGKYVFPDDTPLAPGAFLLVADTAFTFALNNEEDSVRLFNGSGGLVSETAYEDAPSERTWNYDPDKGRYRWSKTLTPGEANRLGNAPSAKVKKEKAVQVVAGLPVEFKGSGKDADGESLEYVWDFGDGHKSYKKNTSHAFKKNGSYTVTLTVSDGTESDTSSIRVRVKKIKKDSVRIVSLVPNPVGSDAKNETLAVTNRSDDEIDLKGWIIATGKDKKHLVNHRINRTIVIKPGRTAIVTRKDSAFTLNNKSQYIELRTPDGKTAQNISYARPDSATDDEAYARTETGWAWQSPAGTVARLAESTAPPTIPPETSVAKASLTNGVDTPTMSAANLATLPRPQVLGADIERNAEKPRLDETGTYLFTAPRETTRPWSVLFRSLADDLNAWLNRRNIFSFLSEI